MASASRLVAWPDQPVAIGTAAAVGIGVACAVSAPWAGLVCGSVLAVIGVVTRRLSTGLLGVVPAGLAAGLPWPTPAAGYLLLTGLAGRRRWRTVGRPSGSAAVLALVALPIAGLVAASQLETAFPVVAIPAPPPWLVVGAVGLAAAANTGCEELLWRVRLFGLLQAAGLGPRPVIVVQALSFGVAHAAGLPGGPTGAVAAAAFGLVLGWLRGREGRIGGCLLVHFAADVAIFAVVADHLVFTG